MNAQNKDRLAWNAREFVRLPRTYEQKYDYLLGILDTLESMGVSTADYNEMEARIESILWPEGHYVAGEIAPAIAPK